MLSYFFNLKHFQGVGVRVKEFLCKDGDLILLFNIVSITDHTFMIINLSLFCTSEIRVGLAIFFSWIWKRIHAQATWTYCQGSLPCSLGLQSFSPGCLLTGDCPELLEASCTPGPVSLILTASKGRLSHSHGSNLPDLYFCLMSFTLDCRKFSAFKALC